MEKQLGKIESATFGLCGYQEAMIGINIGISFGGCGVGYDKSAWDKNIIEHTKNCKWTEGDRSRDYDAIVRYVSDLLNDAKVRSVSKLVGVPVEVTLENNSLKSFRILTEVL